jgi:hypothetical protein
MTINKQGSLNNTSSKISRSFTTHGYVTGVENDFADVINFFKILN